MICSLFDSDLELLLERYKALAAAVLTAGSKTRWTISSPCRSWKMCRRSTRARPFSFVPIEPFHRGSLQRRLHHSCLPGYAGLAAIRPPSSKANLPSSRINCYSTNFLKH
ncbi:hypothetical protein KSP39_PZI021431 [Platanthera zijinensis]|uniref:Uncharacterized protein n=1 Tax=Platanthera zijinensis TaxID=2320716 RepID=A0AAP0AWV3_9ASPA